MTERLIFCRGERIAFTTISLITNKYNAQIFPHLRIKEVANRDWIKEDEFDSALKGSIDFTVARDFFPLLALELDGRFHQSIKARERDRKKDALCDSLDIPLVRLDAGYMRQDLLQPVLADVVETWLNESHNPVTHLHTIRATRIHLEDSIARQRDALGLPVHTPWELGLVSEAFDNGYAEARVEVRFGNSAVIEIGRGRSKVPRRSRICSTALAERIAVADASCYIRTCGHTRKDVLVDTSTPLTGKCELCSAARSELIMQTVSAAGPSLTGR